MDHNHTATDTTIELYGSFRLAQFELALPASTLQEVVNYPAAVTPVPLAPPHLLGLFNLRGTLIPIVDLRPLLGLPSGASHDGRKVAIVELGDMCVGLCFDATGEILRVPAEQTITFDPAAHGTPVICGALKLGGDRILQILSAAALLGLPDVPMHHRIARPERRAQQAQRQQTVSFRVAEVFLALPMAAIQEIIRVPTLQPSPLVDAVCLGMLNLRGSTVPVIDFARFLGLADHNPAATQDAPAVAASADERRIIVLQQQDAHFGLMVAAVRSIVGYRPDDLLPMPAYAQREIGLFAGCLGDNGRDSIILMRPDALFQHPVITEIIHGHHDLYRDAAGQAAARKKARGVRETYVMFRLGHLLGVRISQLREVIDFPQDIVKTPGSPSFVLGVLNLRHELVTIFDVRALLEMPAYADIAHTKVLIVEHEQEKYGLVVDAVENIVAIDSTERIPMPAMLTKQAVSGLRDSMKEAVEIPGVGTLMLIDLVSLCENAVLEAAPL